MCKKDWLKDNNPCPVHNETGKQTYWDDIKRQCTTEKSKTCILHNATMDSMVEKHGKLKVRYCETQPIRTLYCDIVLAVIT